MAQLRHRDQCGPEDAPHGHSRPGAEARTKTMRLHSVVATKKPLRLALGATSVALALLLGACSRDSNTATTGDGAGHEGRSEDGGDGAGHEGRSEDGSAYAPATYLSTSGISRGVFSGPEVQADDYYADKLNDLEFALAYDSASGSFLGRVKNEAGEGLCDTRIKVILDGNQANSQSLVIPSLDVRERATFTLTADTGSFTTWTAQTETFTCDNTPVHGGEGEGGEGGGEGGEGGGEGGEGGGEGGEGGGEGGEGGGHEGGQGGADGGENEGPAVPIDQRSAASINGLDVNIAYDQAAKAFTGVLINNTSAPICGARLEIHVNRGSSTLELGPTVDADWAPGQARNVVLGFDPRPSDTYSLHPEATICS